MSVNVLGSTAQLSSPKCGSWGGQEALTDIEPQSLLLVLKYLCQCLAGEESCVSAWNEVGRWTLLLEDADIKKSRGRRGGLEGNTLLWLWLISPILLVLSVQTASNTSSTWEPIRSVTCMLDPQVLLHQRLRNLCFNKLPGWFWMLLKIGRIVRDPVLTSSEGLLCFGVSSTVKSRFHHWK